MSNRPERRRERRRLNREARRAEHAERSWTLALSALVEAARATGRSDLLALALCVEHAQGGKPAWQINRYERLAGVKATDGVRALLDRVEHAAALAALATDGSR